MKIAPLNTVMQYNIATKKVNFGNNNNKGIDTPINQPQQIKPTLQQLQAHSGISFGGTKEDVLAFIDKAKEQYRYAETFCWNTPVKDIKEEFSQKPEDLKKLLVGTRIFKEATGEQKAAFAEILGDEALKVFAQSISRQEESDKAALLDMTAEQINTLANAFGDNAKIIFKQMLPKQDKDGKTALFYLTADQIKALANVFGKEAKMIFAQMLAMQNKEGETALFCMKADEIKALANVFDKDADVIFDVPLNTPDKYNFLPIYPNFCDSEKMVALIEVAPNSLRKALSTRYSFWPDYSCSTRYYSSYAEDWESMVEHGRLWCRRWNISIL